MINNLTAGNHSPAVDILRPERRSYKQGTVAWVDKTVIATVTVTVSSYGRSVSA